MRAIQISGQRSQGGKDNTIKIPEKKVLQSGVQDFEAGME
jgi:hypothetical protein